MSKQKEELTEIFYELVFWFTGHLTEEEVQTEFQKLKSLIEESEGKIIAETNPQLKTLAYPLKKETSGYFGFVQFELNPEKIEELNNKIKMMTNILHYLIIKKNKKLTLAPTPTQKKKSSAQQPKPEIEKIETLDLQELDKKLDEILKES